MSNIKFTPGPWHVSRQFANQLPLIYDQNGHCVASADAYYKRERPESEANAHLIAAAPDLLEALKNIENDDGRIPEKIWNMRNDAIARAEGRSA